MESLVLLSVLAIMHTSVLARPADMDSEPNTSREDFRENFNPLFIKFPTEMRHGFTVTVNGTLNNKTNETFEAVFLATNKEKQDECKITYEFQTEQLNFLPEPPGVKNKRDYTMLIPGSPVVDNPTFSIKFSARYIGEEERMFKLSFEANSAGPSDVMSCQIENLEDLAYMEFKNGVYNITSLLFEF